MQWVDLDDGRTFTFNIDDSWKSSEVREEGWKSLEFDDSHWPRAVHVKKHGDYPLALLAQLEIKFTDTAPFLEGWVGAGTAAWGDAGVIVPWYIYQCYGDSRIIERHYDAMVRWIDYLKANSTDLIRPAHGYGDWLSVGADTPKDVIATAYFAYSTKLLSRMAAAIGKVDDVKTYGKLDLAYGLLSSTDYPSWGYSIEQGATTMWERWDSYKADGAFQGVGMNSFNRFAYGSVGEWLYRYVAGIEIHPEHPGYKHMIIQPHPGGGLTSAKVSYKSVRGK